MGGEITHIGYPYSPNDGLHTLTITGKGDLLPYRVLLLYVKPSVHLGQTVAAGETIGEAEDVSGYLRMKKPNHPGEMRNHVHLEIRMDGTAVNPVNYLSPLRT